MSHIRASWGPLGEAFALVGQQGYSLVQSMAKEVGITRHNASRIVAGKHGLPDDMDPDRLKPIICDHARRTGNWVVMAKVNQLVAEADTNRLCLRAA